MRCHSAQKESTAALKYLYMLYNLPHTLITVLCGTLVLGISVNSVWSLKLGVSTREEQQCHSALVTLLSHACKWIQTLL